MALIMTRMFDDLVRICHARLSICCGSLGFGLIKI
jgi:hypothetical protein